jgi:hypothetical protein
MKQEIIESTDIHLKISYVCIRGYRYGCITSTGKQDYGSITHLKDSSEEHDVAWIDELKSLDPKYAKFIDDNFPLT